MSFANVVYNHYNGNTWFSSYQIYQQYFVGYWKNWRDGLSKESWFSNSDMYLYDTMSSQESLSVDVTAWHYDSSSNYTNCSY